MRLTDGDRPSEDGPGNVDAAVFRVVRAGNAYEETVERLLQVIKLGIVPHGERLPPERELANRLGVSRVTLREAIRSLQQAGYVEPRRGRFGGTFVLYRPSPSAAEARRIAGVLGGSLEDALTFRRVLEPGVAEAVAQRQLSEIQQARLRERLAEVESAPMTTYRQADARLHLAIAELTGSPMVTRAVAEVRITLNDLLDAIPPLDPPITHSNEQHTALVRALLTHNARQARRVMEDHVDATAALLRGFLS
jgi:GntR family transcriptional regulator, transcriptional repressor for pyruvate dehydrogenase complex